MSFKSMKRKTTAHKRTEEEKKKHVKILATLVNVLNPFCRT